MVTAAAAVGKKRAKFKVLTVIYKAFCLDMAQGHMNGAQNET